MIIGLTGKAGSGKDTAANYLKQKYGIQPIAFAAELKRIVKDLFDFSDEQIYGPSEKRNEPDPRYPRADGTFLTAREALQLCGTDFARKCYENIWVDKCFREIKRLHRSVGGIIIGERQHPHWVITDMRFPSEAKAMREFAPKLEGYRFIGTYVLRINRTSSIENNSQASQHASEMGVDAIQEDIIIDNTGDLPNLYAQLDRFWKEKFLQVEQKT